MGLYQKLKNVYNKINAIYFQLEKSFPQNRKNSKVISAQLLAALNSKKTSITNLSEVEFQVFSQWGDDGIIQYIIDHTEIKNKTFIEFGVENYLESNTRFLLINNNWSGLVMDGSKENIDFILKDEIYWTNDIHATEAFITAENVNHLISQFLAKGYHRNVGILSIDVDGMDYWIWKAVTVIEPIIVIVEYNSVFGAENFWTVPYESNFNRTKAHFSNLYFGASLRALCDLASKKGYKLIGCNSAGNNAYFIRGDVNSSVKEVSPENGYVLSKFRESRDLSGGLNFVSGDQRINLIRGLPVLDVVTNTSVII